MRTSRGSRGMWWRLSKNPLGWSHHVPPVLWRTSVRTGSFWISKSTFPWIKTEESLPKEAAQTCDGFESVSIFQLPQDDSMRTSKHVPTIPMEESKIPASKRNQIDHISTNHHHLNLYISQKPQKIFLSAFVKTKNLQEIPTEKKLFILQRPPPRATHGDPRNWSASKTQLREPQAVILGAQYCSSSTAALVGEPPDPTHPKKKGLVLKDGNFCLRQILGD